MSNAGLQQITLCGYRLSGTLVVSFSPFTMTMKKLLWLWPLVTILCACPFESKVPLAAAPTQPVDSTLVGYWYGIVKDGSDFFGIEALDIAKQSDSVYSITRYGKAVKGDIILPDTAHFTGYISYVGEQCFMNIEGSVVIVTPRRNKAPETRVEKVFYLSALERNHDTLHIKTITENFSASRRDLNTPEALTRIVVESISQQKNIYDELYSLSYKKIPKPQPLIR